MKKIALLMSCLLGAACLTAAAQDLVPRPVSVEPREGAFMLPSMLRIYHSPDTEPLARYLAAELQRLYRFEAVRLTESDKLPSDRAGIIQIYTAPYDEMPAEGYWLNISPRDMLIAGADYGGVFNGIQTLLQLLPDAPPYCSDCRRSDIPIPCINISDYPRFTYRGMLLDVARTFVPKERVKRYIDLLSRHKINKLHWHLTDDEGWRIELKSHPELAAVGGFRGGDSPILPVYGAWDRKYGGYYTQDDIREIVAYAALRNVEIIPEIDLPGHSRAAARVMPAILCSGPYDTTPTNGYDDRNVWCVAEEANYRLLEEILGEVADLFLSPWIHIGGDEVNTAQWAACPRCRALMRDRGYTEYAQLQHHFMERVIGILERLGKRAAVWNEATDGGPLSGSPRVHGWQNPEVCRRAAAAGYRTVAMPAPYFYFDMRYSPSEPGQTWAGCVPTDKVYSFNLDAFTPDEQAAVEGVESALWHELGLLHGPAYLERQTYPRLCALAEVAWTPQELRDWNDFEARMERTHYARLSRMGVRYRTQPAPAEAETLLTPEVAFSSSFRDTRSNPFSVLTDYTPGAYARTTRGAREGDHLLFRFAKPVACRSVTVSTGYDGHPRRVFPGGCAEIQYAGETTFHACGELANGCITIRPAAPVQAIRIRCTTPPDGEDAVIIRPLRIVALP